MKYCIWCFAPEDTTNHTCPSPDGDGHLFSLESLRKPTDGEPYIPVLLEYDEDLLDWRPF